MGSPSRFINFSARSGQSENATDPANPQPQVFAVAPLNSAPYIGPAMTQSQAASMPTTRKDSEAVDKVGPAMIYMPCQSTTKEWDALVAATQSGIALTGSAALGKVGPAIGLLDIGECEDSYLFRVSLPGVAREKDFSCEIEPDGKVMIKGITMTGEKIVCKNSLIFDMQTQNLCPPGHFSITFYLPGAVDHQQYSGYFGIDGILEGIVKKT